MAPGLEDVVRKLQAIRGLVEVDTSGCTVDDVEEHGKRLAAMIGLSAETMAQAECAEESAVYDYADRLNAGITHQLDFYRTVISKYKEELRTSMQK